MQRGPHFLADGPNLAEGAPLLAPREPEAVGMMNGVSSGSSGPMEVSSMASLAPCAAGGWGFGFLWVPKTFRN